MLSSGRKRLGAVWQLVVPYFQSQEKSVVSLGPLGNVLVKESAIGRGLLLAIFAVEGGQVCLAVVLNQWNARFYDSLQNKDIDAFWHEMMVFSLIAGAFIVSS